MNNDGPNQPQTPPVATDVPPAQEPPATETTLPPAAFTAVPNEPQQQSGSDAPETPKKKHRRGLVAAIIVAAAVVILGGGGAAAYNLYYQNPQKVISDALAYAVSADTATSKGTAEIKTDDATVGLTFDGKSDGQNGTMNVTAKITADNADVTVKGSGLFDKDGNLYFKLQDIKESLNELMNASESAVDLTPFDAVVAKLENKWVKVAANDLSDYSENYGKTQTCVSDAMKLYSTDKDAKNEITTLYKDNQFLSIDQKLGGKQIDGVGSIGYAFSVDTDKVKTFQKAFDDTMIGKKIADCNKDAKASKSTATEDASKAKVTGELWVSRFRHVPTEMNIKAVDDDTTLKADFLPKFNENVKVDIPADTTTLKQVVEDLSKAYEDYLVSAFAAQQ